MSSNDKTPNPITHCGHGKEYSCLECRQEADQLRRQRNRREQALRELVEVNKANITGNDMYWICEIEKSLGRNGDEAIRALFWNRSKPDIRKNA